MTDANREEYERIKRASHGAHDEVMETCGHWFMDRLGEDDAEIHRLQYHLDAAENRLTTENESKERAWLQIDDLKKQLGEAYEEIDRLTNATG